MLAAQRGSVVRSTETSVSPFAETPQRSRYRNSSIYVAALIQESALKFPRCEKGAGACAESPSVAHCDGVMLRGRTSWDPQLLDGHGRWE